MMDMGITSVSMPSNIEIGRWYDIKIVIMGNNVKGYLDDKLLQEVGDSRTSVKSLCASAARDDKSGDIILKVVNASGAPQDTEVNLVGVGNVAPDATAIVLTSNGPEDENTLAHPNAAAPVTLKIKIGSTFRHTFPPYSLTIIRMKNRM